MTEVSENTYEFNSRISLDFLDTSNRLITLDHSMIQMWLNDYIRFNPELRRLSRRLYSSDGVYTNVIDYFVGLPQLTPIVVSINHNAKLAFEEALRSIRHRQFMHDALRAACIDGTVFYYFYSRDKVTLPKSYSDEEIHRLTEINSKSTSSLDYIMLPVDYCRIVGTQKGSYIVAFDFSYFDQFISNGLALKLRSYPKEFREKYKLYEQNRHSKRWQTLDWTKTVTGKFRATSQDETWGRPLGLAAFVSALFGEFFSEARREVLKEANGNTFMHELPLGNDGKSTLTQKQQEEQHGHVKSALTRRQGFGHTAVFTVAAGTKVARIPVDLDLLKTELETKTLSKIAADLGFAGSSLTGEGGTFASQQTNLQLLTGQVYEYVEQFKNELQKVINANVTGDEATTLCYLPITSANKKEYSSQMESLYTKGSGSLAFWIASTGIEPNVYITQMDYERQNKYDEKYPPHKISFTSSNKESDTKPHNENTNKSNTYGSNNHPDT